MGLCISPDIFQETIHELFVGLDTVHACLDGVLVITNIFPVYHLN